MPSNQNLSKLTSLSRLLYPFLIAGYPIIHAYSANASSVPFREMVLPLGIVWGFTAVIVALLWVTLRSLKESLFISSLSILFIFLSKPLCDFIFAFVGKRNQGAGLFFVFAMSIVLIFIIARIFRREEKILQVGESILATFSICAVLFALLQAGMIVFSGSSLEGQEEQINPKDLENVQRPDIYYIILDGYGNSRTLKDLYDFDNSEMVKSLEQNGFYVASNSYANYGQTLMSLAASLNMRYLDPFTKENSSGRNLGPIQKLLFNNKVVRYLRRLGYSVITIPSGYSGTDIPKPDVKIEPDSVLSEFENLLLSESILPTVLRHLPIGKSKDLQYEMHRKRITFALDTLPYLPKLSSPKFVFVHVLAPHPPFVLDENGQSLTPRGKFHLQDGNIRVSQIKPNGYRKGYRGQVAYISKRVQEIVPRLIAASPDAIIIIQGDHGPGLELNWKNIAASNISERMGILNAYRVPEAMRGRLYDSISPVNSFRIILTSLFNENFETLEDKSLLSSIYKPYKVIDVSDKLRLQP